VAGVAITKGRGSAAHGIYIGRDVLGGIVHSSTTLSGWSSGAKYDQTKGHSLAICELAPTAPQCR